MRRASITILILCISICLAAPAAIAETVNSEQGLTLQQAVEQALKYDRGLKKAEAVVERTEYLREEAGDRVQFTPIMGEFYDPITEVNWNMLLSADLTWRMSKKMLEADRDALVLRTCKGYWDVQAAQGKLVVQERLEQQALLNLQNARVGLQTGTIAPYQVATADAAWQQAKYNLGATGQELENAYSLFNQLLGLKADERLVLTDMPAYEPLEINSLNYEVARVIADSPSTWLAQQKVTLQEWAADMMFSSGEYTPYKARQIAVDQAELDAASAEDLMEQVTRSLYHTTKGLEDAYSAAEEALKTAQENLRIVNVKYDVGMATKADVVAAEVAVAQVEHSLADLTRQHAYLKLAFEKPWAAN